jgi:hypothetical protein
VELAERVADFRARGLEIAAVSYDAAPVLAAFAERRRIPFALLSDPGSQVIRRFGLLDPRYPEADQAHGVPRPATFIVDAQGVVRARSLEEGYVPRPTARGLLSLVGESPRAEVVARRDERITVRVGQSDAEAFPGNRLTLVVDVELTPGLHAYAPGEHAYRALRLQLAANPLVRVHDPVFPRPRPFHFRPLRETVPVYEGRFQVRQDVTLADRRALADLLASAEPRLTLEAVLDYQLCSETICHPPSRAPLQWSIRVRAPDTERVPEALRRK